MCETGKQEYSSAREAREAVNAFKARHRNFSTGKRVKKNYVPQRAYKCDICGHYHVTSKNRK